ncbi:MULTISPECIES: hypothetical protein [unclassified Aliivibrio]|jgi:hypothetical protein|uniref:hypothetical protein n=1 Tax=unclassified Aliivibrio TaxID=2645654 RepID=UPI00080E1B2E|nr:MULTISPECIES: hypothetical protein [unclassified Aliivibrio]OCH15439.1 hypothetical protein A6E03_01925 [Aliivibrio sp. 1S128]OCH18031.1 hypothetical protein A6E05_11865 [Aliivibrio sp. 1S165]OCH35408.1 hypothetical protein A6E06_12605 [Aliivibrio sp. 1S175]
MKLAALLLPFTLFTASAHAANTECLSNQYSQYVDASLTWYKELISITVKKDPNLKSVGNWFLEGRKHHFEFNRAAVDFYLKNDPSKVKTNQSIESWLQLDQKEIKTLASNNDALGKVAKVTFDDRQSQPHKQNYELRSAFADILSHPKEIDAPLNAYNQKMSGISEINCL